MDKYEYKVRAEEIKALIAEGEFVEAVKIADTIDWRRVKSVMMLCTISDLYKINRRFQESKDILLMAYERHPGGRLIVYSLCELSIKMGEFVQAIEYYKEFVQIAPKDTGRYILQYKLYEAQDVSLEERIAVLEEFKKRDYREKWAYELAYLYHRVGLETKCVEECDEMILWFGEGRYVMKALELKMLHQPLSAMQQEKYLLMKQELEQPEEPETVEQSEETSAEYPAEYPAEEVPAEIPEQAYDMAGYPQQPEQPIEVEEDFRVKTVDLGQYNTINLQQALAESMKEIMAEEEQNEPEASSMGVITESIVAPLLQETDKLPFVLPGEAVTPAVSTETPIVSTETPAAFTETPVMQEQPDIAKQQEPVQIPEPRIETEEVFFEEDVKDILLEDTKEINVGDTKEIHPKKRVIYPTATPVQAAQTMQPTESAEFVELRQSLEQKQAAEQKQSVAEPVQPAVATGPSLIKPMTRPSGFEQMLSQEYDGQISLVIPNNTDVEKQITGQMNITDILAEWERTKRENEEKRREEVRKRVQMHTGNLLSEFDEATKTGLLEQLEPAVLEAILKESSKKVIMPNQSVVADNSKKEESVGHVERTESAGDIRDKENQKEISIDEEALKTPQITEAEEVTATAQEQPVDIVDSQSVEEQAADVKEQENSPENTERIESADNTDTRLVKDETSDEDNKCRVLTEEEKELFARFIHNRKTREQITFAIDNISMDSYNGNVIITGEEEAGTMELAKNLVRILQMTDRNFTGKVAKISGDTLNKKDVQATLEKIPDGALIIEYGTEMSSGTAGDLNKVLAKEGKGIFVIIAGKRDEMNIFLRKNHILMDNFNVRIDIESLDDQALVEYAKQYAEEMEYSIDELGILALHTRIADMQTSDHEVSVAEVRDLVDDAIYFADKKNPKHFFDILFGKRYDEEDMIILREKDFMHY